MKLNILTGLLNLALFELNVLARDGIIFLFDHFFSHCPRILLRDIEIAGTRGRVQTDFNGCWLRHDASAFLLKFEARELGRIRRYVNRAIADYSSKSGNLVASIWPFMAFDRKIVFGGRSAFK